MRILPKIHVTYIVSPEIRFQFPCQNLQCCTLSDTVSSHEAKYLTRSWSRESVQFEGVGSITVCDLRF